MTIELVMGSSTAKGIATRRGVGKVKHLETKSFVGARPSWRRQGQDKKRSRTSPILRAQVSQRSIRRVDTSSSATRSSRVVSSAKCAFSFQLCPRVVWE